MRCLKIVLLRFISVFTSHILSNYQEQPFLTEQDILGELPIVSSASRVRPIDWMGMKSISLSRLMPNYALLFLSPLPQEVLC